MFPVVAGTWGFRMGGWPIRGVNVTMEADRDAGTLKFWVNGKPHGPGWTSGVTGRLRWATTVGDKTSAVQIVPTPELE